MNKRHIAFIGMTSSGKTTIGEEFARSRNLKFIDTDRSIEELEGNKLIEILKDKGRDYLQYKERDLLMEIDDAQGVHVISPGGSVIYDDGSMAWMSNNCLIIFIDTPISIIKDRLEKQPKAIFGLVNGDIDALYKERIPLYKKYADATIASNGRSLEEMVRDAGEIVNKFLF